MVSDALLPPLVVIRYAAAEAHVAEGEALSRAVVELVSLQGWVVREHLGLRGRLEAVVVVHDQLAGRAEVEAGVLVYWLVWLALDAAVVPASWSKYLAWV